MRVGVPKEIKVHEYRVGLTPASVAELTAERLADHLAWRLDRGLDDEAELTRATVHLARLGAWLDQRHGTTIGAERATNPFLRQIAHR